MLIVFDLDDTLIDTSGSVTPFKLRSILEMLSRRGVEIHNFESAYQQMRTLNEASFSSKEAIYQTLEKLKALPFLDEAFAHATAPLPSNFLVPTTPNAKKVLRTLKEKGHRLALVTGGKPSFQLEKLEKAGLQAGFFSKIAIPEDSKKGPYYEDLLKEFLVPPSETFVVGDRIPMDLVPAHQLGIRTVHMRWGRGLLWKTEQWIDYSIRELSELLDIV